MGWVTQIEGPMRDRRARGVATAIAMSRWRKSAPTFLRVVQNFRRFFRRLSCALFVSPAARPEYDARKSLVNINGPFLRLKESDIARAFRAGDKAGKRVQVEIDVGRKIMRVIPMEPGEANDDTAEDLRELV
jgi:hypothetical protein